VLNVIRLGNVDFSLLDLGLRTSLLGGGIMSGYVVPRVLGSIGCVACLRFNCLGAWARVPMCVALRLLFARAWAEQRSENTGKRQRQAQDAGADTKASVGRDPHAYTMPLTAIPRRMHRISSDLRS
jgi:hypothetical protein